MKSLLIRRRESAFRIAPQQDRYRNMLLDDKNIQYPTVKFYAKSIFLYNSFKEGSSTVSTGQRSLTEKMKHVNTFHQELVWKADLWVNLTYLGLAQRVEYQVAG